MKFLGKNALNNTLPLLIGTVAFLFLIGPKVLEPTNIAWLSKDDRATFYISWLFFRNSPWSFPIGLNPNYGLNLSSSLLYSDANPLLAFIFKPFSSLLSEPFQYFGIWLFICIVMQAWFAWKLVGLISESIIIRTLATGLFVFAPPLLIRLPWHINLSSHFLILAGLYLVFCPMLKKRSLAWICLLAVTALIHPYLLMMVMGLWLADFGGKILQKKLSLQSMFFEVLIIFTVLSFIGWQVGYWTAGTNTGAMGFGDYRMNFLSIINPVGWSYVLKSIPLVWGEIEGFNFLGLGMIFLIITALPAIFAGNLQLKQKSYSYIVLCIILLGFTVFALSNRIAIGPFGFDYPIPPDIRHLCSIFRASGRFFWPVFYTIVFVTIFLVVKGYRSRVAIPLLAIALIIQIADTSIAWKIEFPSLSVTSNNTNVWTTPLIDPFWKIAAKKYKKVLCILPRNPVKPELYWRIFAYYAATHGLPTNAVYAARGSSHLKKYSKTIAQELKTGNYEADALYILNDAAYPAAVASLHSKTDLLTAIDGFHVLAPGWKKIAKKKS